MWLQALNTVWGDSGGWGRHELVGHEAARCYHLHKAAVPPLLRILYILDAAAAAALSTDCSSRRRTSGVWGLGGAERRGGRVAFRRSTWSSVCRGGSERPWPAPGGPCRCSALRRGCPPHWDHDEEEERKEWKGHSLISFPGKRPQTGHQHLSTDWCN